jgi:DNA-binding transcriptional ArsR family regulator
MSRGLPLRSSVDSEPDERVCTIEDAGPVFEALTSETARTVLRQLHRSPAPASEVAEAVGTSIQNATYHLDRLDAVGLVDRVETWYSAKGREMDVYAPVLVTIVCAPDATDD